MTLSNQMNEPMSKERKPNGNHRRFSQEQYDVLKRCSERKDMTEWNQWRRKKHSKPILLEGVDLSGEHLETVNFYGAHLENADLQETHLEDSNLSFAHLQNAKLSRNA
ncbi:MAG: hypothetical protein D4R45_01265 [Planctomycetaceae bacterium]|nr:MAG: hypothetical protein D4R45_01265 [Planctomycetaceae bacterium]